MEKQSALVLVITLLLAILRPNHVIAQPVDDNRIRFDNSIVKVPASLAPNALTAATKKNSSLQLHFVLHARNIDELQSRVAQGEVLSPEEMAKYSGDKGAADDLVKWLQANGYEIVDRTPDNTSVYARASLETIEKSLSVKMAKVTYKGKRDLAAITAPSLPREIGGHVLAIDGLQPFVRAVKHFVPRERYLRTAKKKAAFNTSKSSSGKNTIVASKAAATNSSTLRVADILNAYGATGLHATGKGEVIAILIDTFPDTSDLASFWSQNGIAPAPSVTMIKVQGNATPLPPKEGEETLDTEWTSGLAPGAETRVYATSSLQFEYIDKALEAIYADAVKVSGLRRVSISLGLREDLVSPGEIQTEHELFLKLAAIGVTVFMSSGDAGSNPDETGHGRSNDANVEYESSDPATIAVGGTTLKLDPGAAVKSEDGWSDSGGGISRRFKRPAWQPAVAGLGDGRLVPDVSAVADPDPGAFVILSGQEWPVGGTSWSAPIWAGIHALLVDACQRQGKSLRGFLGPMLYKIPPGKGLRDIVTGSNGLYQARPGWDAVTGLGVPDATALLASLPCSAKPHAP